MALETEYKLGGYHPIKAYVQINSINIVNEEVLNEKKSKPRDRIYDKMFVVKFDLLIKGKKGETTLEYKNDAELFKFPYDLESKKNVLQQVYEYVATLPEFKKSKKV